MTGTFASFNTALSAIRYQRVAMDTASNNIANVDTPGYTRRRAEAQAVSGSTQVAMWSRSDGVGAGVSAGAATRMADPLLDARSRHEHGKQSFLTTRVAVLERVESGLGEPGDSGVTAALAEFRNAWQDLESHPDQSASRSQVLSVGRALADAVNAQAGNVASEQATQRSHLLDLVNEANTVARDLGAVNRSIADAGAYGVDDADLRDQRDVLALRLSELTGGVATARSDGGIDVRVGGQPLVTGRDVTAIAVTGGVAADGSDPGTPLAWTVGGQQVAVSLVGGEVGAVGELLATTLPDLLTGLDGVAAALADTVNALHSGGYDQDGTAGTAFFSYDPALGAARSLSVAITDPRRVVASSVPGGGLDTGVAAALGDVSAADSAYERLVNGLATQITSGQRLAATQKLLTSQVDGAREQLVGVSFDEETVNLVAAQRGYEAAARVMTTLDSVLDTLINRTGIS